MKYDLVVIGGGSAGYSAASTAIGYGKSVAVVEKGPFGGLCILKGCMPSKTILHSAEVARTIDSASEFGVNVSGKVSYNAAKIIDRKNQIIREFVVYREEAIRKKVDLIDGFSEFYSNNAVKVNREFIEGENFLVSTGSRIFVPDIPGLDDVGYITSDDALELREFPESLVVLGGGPVTLEMATYFSSLGVKTSIIQRSDHVLSSGDEDLARVVEESFRNRGVDVYTGAQLRNFSMENGKKRVEFEQNGKSLEVMAEQIFAGFGRVPDFVNLGLERTEMELDERGYPVLNDYLQTSLDNIYVAGDANGLREVVNVAVDQGRIVAENMFSGREKKGLDYSKYALVTFTDPEIAQVGLTEKEAKKKRLDFKVGKLPYEDLGKAVCIGKEEGFIKAIVDNNTDRILGIGIVGYLATDIISTGVSLLYFNATLQDLKSMSNWFAHPTIGEIYSYLAEEM